jgi:hypothetical membrane protein
MDRVSQTGASGSIQPLAGTTLAFAAGVAAIGLYLACSTAAWWFYPRPFSPLRNWLSDLGNSLRNPRGALFYNVGCALTAAALFLFVLGLSRWRSGRRLRDGLIAAAQVAGIVSAFSLLMVGVYSQDLARQHLFYSNSFFSSFPVFMVLHSTALTGHPRSGRSLGILGFVVVVVGLGFHWLFPVSRPLEWVTEAGFLLFVGLVAWNTQRVVAPKLAATGSTAPDNGSSLPGARSSSTTTRLRPGEAESNLSET